MLLCKVAYDIFVERGAELAHLTHVGHLARLVCMFHVVQKERFVLKGPLTDLAHF